MAEDARPWTVCTGVASCPTRGRPVHLASSHSAVGSRWAIRRPDTPTPPQLDPPFEITQPSALKFSGIKKFPGFQVSDAVSRTIWKLRVPREASPGMPSPKGAFSQTEPQRFTGNGVPPGRHLLSRPRLGELQRPEFSVRSGASAQAANRRAEAAKPRMLEAVRRGRKVSDWVLRVVACSGVGRGVRKQGPPPGRVARTWLGSR